MGSLTGWVGTILNVQVFCGDRRTDGGRGGLEEEDEAPGDGEGKTTEDEEERLVRAGLFTAAIGGSWAQEAERPEEEEEQEEDGKNFIGLKNYYFTLKSIPEPSQLP